MEPQTQQPADVSNPATGIGLGVFFFAAIAGEGAEAHQLVLDCARSADEMGLAFVSTPERHFHRFGGAFPNPAVTSAAVAAVTHRIQIRAGSVVTPLHHPVRVVEDFAVVDVLSGGRTAICVGSGWNVNDFSLAPGEYTTRRERMASDIDTIRQIWRDGRWTTPNPLGNEVTLDVFPRPVQPELPLWITASRSKDTFVEAGRIGANVLTHLENQDLAALREKIAAYRASRAEHGHQGPGRVTVMMHTYVAETTEQAREVAVPWLRKYLLTALDLETKAVASGGTMSGGRTGRKVMAQEDARGRVAELGVNRYLSGASLIGSVEECAEVARTVQETGVDEIACLVDFVGEPKEVLAGMTGLGRLHAVLNEVPALAVTA
jgi:natural product biosynthesis luciferase-like monooxygenase protein